MEFKLNKTQRLLTNAASKDESRLSLHCLHITKGKIQAANGFILMERNLDYDNENVLLNISDIAKHKDAKGLEGVVYTKDGDNIKAIGQDINIISPVVGTFPETGRLYPTSEPVFQIGLSRNHLLDMLKCLDKGENLIKFTFYGKESPAKLEVGDDVLGLIMPMSIK